MERGQPRENTRDGSGVREGARNEMANGTTSAPDRLIWRSLPPTKVNCGPRKWTHGRRSPLHPRGSMLRHTEWTSWGMTAGPWFIHTRWRGWIWGRGTSDALATRVFVWTSSLGHTPLPREGSRGGDSTGRRFSPTSTLLRQSAGPGGAAGARYECVAHGTGADSRKRAGRPPQDTGDRGSRFRCLGGE